MEAKEIIDALQMKHSLIHISHEIIEHNRGVEDIALIGIKTRGETLARRLVDIIHNVEDISVPCFALDVSRWRDDRERPYPLSMEPLPVKDKRVILMDDVLFKRRTVRAVMDAIVHYGGAKEIQLAVLVNRRHRGLPIRADCIGKDIPSSLHEVIRVRVSEIDGDDDVSIGKWGRQMDKAYVLDFASKLLGTDSPTGYTKKAIDLVADEAATLDYQTKCNNKGNPLIYVKGSSSEKAVGFCVHCDILELMVRSIKSNGMLAVTDIGGPIIPTLDREYCRIHTRDDEVYSGTVLSCSPASHVYKDVSTRKREIDEMEVRIDKVVKTKADMEAFGICNDNFVAIDPKVQTAESGFIKFRFLDNKISASVPMSVLQHMKEHNITLTYDLIFMMSTYEEVSHGMSHVSECINELIVVDMGCIGLDLARNEQDVSIYAKDSSGPYDYEMTSRLIELAKEKKLCCAVDIYPMYGSDVNAALRGGCDIRGTLIGPGVHASHGMERTHYDGVEDTIKPILAYIS